MTAEQSLARWAGKTIEIGGDNTFVPWVLDPSNVPEITDEQQAMEDPELSVLSAMAHARDADTNKAIRIALVAKMVSLGLDADRSQLYCDLVFNALPEVARRALQTAAMNRFEYPTFLGRSIYCEGMANVVLAVLTGRFGELSIEVTTRVRESSIPELETMSHRLVSAQTLEEAIGAP